MEPITKKCYLGGVTSECCFSVRIDGQVACEVGRNWDDNPKVPANLFSLLISMIGGERNLCDQQILVPNQSIYPPPFTG